MNVASFKDTRISVGNKELILVVSLLSGKDWLAWKFTHTNREEQTVKCAL